MESGSGPHDVLFKMGGQPLSDSEARLCESKDDDTIISMQKPGHGGKNVKQWAKNLAVLYLEDKDPGTRLEVGTGEGEVVVDLDEKMRKLEEDKAFWRKSYDIWKDFKYCRPKIIYAADLLESLQMRLTYFLHNSQETALVNITLPPFEFGIKQVSYTTLVWHYFHKENEQSWSLNEKEWINFCMNYSEVNYVMDLKSKGLKLEEEASEVAGKIRQEMQVYIIHLKSQNNASAHVFSTVVRQKTSAHHGERAHPKVRTLLDVVVPDVSFEYGRELLHLLQTLTTKPPEEFKSLHICFRMQSHFLKFVLENRKYEHHGSAPNYPSLPQFPANKRPQNT